MLINSENNTATSMSVKSISY